MATHLTGPWDTDPPSVSQIVGTAVGAASVCWEHMEGTGIFNDVMARQIVEDTIELLKSRECYVIKRFYADRDKDTEIIVRGLTVEQAVAHCQRDDTKGQGWFDGYEIERRKA